MSLSRYNNTIAPLENAQSFVGVWEDCLSAVNVLVSAYSDQNCRVKVEFTHNEEDIITEEFTAVASVLLSKGVRVKGNQYRLVVENNSGSDMSVLRCHTQLRESHSHTEEKQNVNLYSYHANPVVSTLKDGTSNVSDGDVEQVVDMGVADARNNCLTVQGSTTSGTYKFVLEYSSDNTNFYSDGTEPELYNAGNNIHTFSFTRTDLLCRFVRIKHKAVGNGLRMEVISARH
jgi:hypothetical protein